DGGSLTGSTVTWSPNFGFALAASRIPDERLAGVRLDGVRSFWNAAERIHFETFEAFAERFEPYGLRPDALRTNYGCAENIGGATFSVPEEPVPVETVDPESLRERGVARETSGSGGVTVVGVGRAAPGIAVRILSEGGRPLGDGEVGRLALRTPSRMEEYLDDEDATREAIRDGWLVTADLAYTRGEEVFWVGRVQERIVINARKYDPSDFERVLFEIEGLRPGCFVAFGTDDPEAGTQALVIVSEVVDPGLVGDPDLVSTVRRRIFTEHGVRPRRVVLVPRGSLPKTSSGKRRHRHFKKRYLETDER
ncbi:MAG: AMP-binding protein, partial [Gemmatimonadota bacterium]|nr:AMP-binding protein [Gemmatimonadota bacterium]